MFHDGLDGKSCLSTAVVFYGALPHETTEKLKKQSVINLQPIFRRDLVAALWDKKLAFRTRERRKFWVFTDGPQRKEKKTSSEAVLRLNSASEKESVLLKEDQTDL
ncbi:hypothetical protein TNCV_1793501 [Trichonephila clavipes]|nr:hypothetical protein TNCV_1793501 [Trichonephila clavipes]